MPELAAMKIKFGSTHVGRTYQHMWDAEQEYITWFLPRFGNSTKLDHRLFVRFIELQIETHENWGATVPVTAEKAQTESKQDALTANPKMVPKAKSKSKSRSSREHDRVPAFLDMHQEEEYEFWKAEWEAMDAVEQASAHPVSAPSDPEVQTLQNRMLNLENALQQVITHLQGQNKTPLDTPEQP